MDNFSPLLSSFVLPILIALLGAAPSTYLLVKEWKRTKHQDTIAHMTAAGEITDAAAVLVRELREECEVLRLRLSNVEKINKELNAEVERLSKQIIYQAGKIDRQEIRLREQEKTIIKQNERISDLEHENECLRKKNSTLANDDTTGTHAG